jgi:hypothetical protein
MSGTGRQLPEDFVMRLLVWAQHYFPADFLVDKLLMRMREISNSLAMQHHEQSAVCG